MYGEGLIGGAGKVEGREDALRPDAARAGRRSSGGFPP